VDTPEFSMSCEQDPRTSRYIVTVTGEIDVATVPVLRDFLLALDGDVEVNCERVSFVDSAGLGLFVGAHRHLTETGRHLRLRRPSASCYKLFEITGLTGFLDLAPAVR